MRNFIIFLLLVGTVAGMYKVIEFFVPHKLGPAELVGILKTEEPADLEISIDKYFEKVNLASSFKCAHVFYGLDEKYAYVEMFCSNFTLEGEKMRMNGGGSMPTRLALNDTHDDIVGYQQPQNNRNISQDVPKIFPPEVKELWLHKVSSHDKSELIFDKIKRKLGPVNPEMSAPSEGLPDSTGEAPDAESPPEAQSPDAAEKLPADAKSLDVDTN